MTKKTQKAPPHKPHSQRIFSTRNHGRSTLRAELVKGDDPEDEFTPLAPPARILLHNQEVSGDLIDHLDSELHLELLEGSYSLPLTDDEPFIVQVPQECQCDLHVVAHRAVPERAPKPESTSFDRSPPNQRAEPTAPNEAKKQAPKTILSSLDVKFSSSLVLPNVWAVLAQLPTLFKDHDLLAVKKGVESLLKSDTASNIERIGRDWVSWLQNSVDLMSPEAAKVSRGIGGVMTSALKGAKDLQKGVKEGLYSWKKELRRSPQKLPTIKLRSLKARPVWKRKQWELELSFSGEVVYANTFVRNFQNVVLPRSILPAPHALLHELLGPSPLATAQMDLEKLDPEELARRVAPAIVRLRGRFNLSGRPPLLAFSMPTPDEGILDAEVYSADTLTLKGRFAAEVEPDEMSLQLDDLSLGDGENRIAAKLRLQITKQNGSSPPSQTSDAPQRHPIPVVQRCVEAAFGGYWPHDELKLRAQMDVHPDSKLTQIEAALASRHALAKGETKLFLQIAPLEIGGHLLFATGPEPQSVVWERTEVSFSALAEVFSRSAVRDGETTIHPSLSNGTLNGQIHDTPEGFIRIDVDGSAEVTLEADTPIHDFPEFNIEKGELLSYASGKLDFTSTLKLATPRGTLSQLEIEDGKVRFVASEGRMSLGSRSLEIPADARFSMDISEGRIATTGMGSGKVALSWDLQGRSPVLKNVTEKGESSIELFVQELRQGSFYMGISEVGGVSIWGRKKGLYDAHFFNALVNPGAEPTKWMEMMEDDEAMEKVLAALAMFSKEMSDLLAKLRDFVRRVADICKKRGSKTSKTSSLPREWLVWPPGSYKS